MIAVASALLHLICLAKMSAGAVPNAIMTFMILGCLYCAHHLWTRAANQDWALLAVMNLAMVCVHLPMADRGHSHHSQVAMHAMTQATSTSDSAWMTGTLAVSCAEAAIAALVLFYRTRAVDVTSAAIDDNGSGTKTVGASSLDRHSIHG